MFGWFRHKKELKDHLRQTKTVYIKGIRFEIRRLNVLDYASGAETIRRIYDTYSAKKELQPEEQQSVLKKVRAHYADAMLAAVVRPILTRDGSGESVGIDEIFLDWELAEKLYEEIIGFTYGKKKLI